jgi:hypothetical protein
MQFNRHSEVQGRHAPLSASKHHWLGYDNNKLRLSMRNNLQAQRGTDLHDLAARDIVLGMKRPKNRSSFNCYVNDGIGFRMSPEVVLFVTYNAFGTADCIGYREEVIQETGEKLWVLRIHDLKTGTTRTAFTQLEVYAAYFCLEYKKSPYDMLIVLRIYQNDEPYKEFIPDPRRIEEIMEKTINADAIYDQVRLEDAL